MIFGFLTINNGRLNVLKLWGSSTQRLRREIDIDFPIVCVSGQEDIAICNHYNIHHITAPNHPASNKWNIGLEWLRTQDIEYVIILGSDDILSTQTLANIIVATNSAPDLIGFNSLYVYSASGSTKGKIKHITTKGVLGVGKTVHRRVLDATNWRPWDYGAGRSWGMDSIFSRNTAQHIKSRIIVDGVIVDVKTAESLNKFSMFERNRHGVDADNSIFYNILSDEEKKILAEIEGQPRVLDCWLTKK
jgi:hypothetical protein